MIIWKVIILDYMYILSNNIIKMYCLAITKMLVWNLAVYKLAPVFLTLSDFISFKDLWIFGR